MEESPEFYWKKSKIAFHYGNLTESANLQATVESVELVRRKLIMCWIFSDLTQPFCVGKVLIISAGIEPGVRNY